MTRRLPFIGTAAIGLSLLLATSGFAQERDADEIRSTIMSGYIDGLQKNGSRDDIRAAFHPDFVMKVFDGNKITNVTIEDWIGRLPPEGQAPDREVTAQIPTVSISGIAATALVNVMYDGEHVFTDYMSLYRFPEGWRIVAKIFNSES